MVGTVSRKCQLTQCPDTVVSNSNVHNPLFQSNANGSAFYLDRGPLFSSLPHLVEYYCKYADGIEGKLLEAIVPRGESVQNLFKT